MVKIRFEKFERAVLFQVIEQESRLRIHHVFAMDGYNFLLCGGAEETSHPELGEWNMQLRGSDHGNDFYVSTRYFEDNMERDLYYDRMTRLLQSFDPEVSFTHSVRPSYPEFVMPEEPRRRRISDYGRRTSEPDYEGMRPREISLDETTARRREPSMSDYARLADSVDPFEIHTTPALTPRGRAMSETLRQAQRQQEELRLEMERRTRRPSLDSSQGIDSFYNVQRNQVILPTSDSAVTYTFSGTDDVTTSSDSEP